MKRIVLIASLLFFTNMYCQEKPDKYEPFVRVYNLDYKKTHKGRVVSISDTLLQLRRNKKITNIPVSSIGKIKTKRSNGHNILTGAAVGSGLAIVFASSSGEESFYEGYSGLGTLLFGGTGAAVGGITTIFKNSITYHIDGKNENLKVFKEIRNN
ncbi:hypothetical protein [Psychroserpens sp. MEBiC05023]